MTLELSKNQFRHFLQQKSAQEAAAAELKAAQFVMAKADALHNATASSLFSYISSLTLDGCGEETPVGSQVQYEEKDGKYLLTVKLPLKTTTQAAG